MTRKRKVSWDPGVVFAVPLPDGSVGIGQAIALMWANVVYCALTDRRLPSASTHARPLDSDSVVARVALTREQLDYGAWPLLGEQPPVCAKADFSNERFASQGYVGAVVYDAALAEDFLAAFHALTPWDNWHDPDYLDHWLVSPDRKPRVLQFKSGTPAS
jgi:hypothetical protein